MKRLFGAGALLLLLAATIQAAAPTGNWKLSVFTGKGFNPFALVTLQNADGKWSGTVELRKAPKSTVENISVKGDLLRFDVLVGEQKLSFEGLVPKEGGKVSGNIANSQELVPAELERTTLTKLDPLEMLKEIVNAKDPTPEMFGAAEQLLARATEIKAKPEEVRAWADRSFKAAGAYGPRWQEDVGASIAGALIEQDEFASIGLEYAQKTARLLDESSDANRQLRLLEIQLTALKKAGKKDELKELDARVAKLVARDRQEYEKSFVTFKADAFAGRKAKGDRAVLVELFTGVQCPPCVAADLAFDQLNKSFKPADVVLLQYHLHIPGADALTNLDNETRANYYAIEGTPSTFVNGRRCDVGGGASEAKESYQELRQTIEPILETPPGAKLTGKAARKADAIDVAIEWADLEKAGEKVRLRLALVEDEVRYTGTNGVRYHHRIVRNMPGGPDGTVLKDKSGKHAVSVNVAELRTQLDKYLADYGKKDRFPSSARPLDLKDLSVVAWVQNDATKEVFQALDLKISDK